MSRIPRRASDGNDRLWALQLLTPGRFVEVTGDPRFVGLLVELTETFGEVDFFHSASRSTRERIEVPRLKRAFLGPQTRVYFRTGEERWRMGRVRNYMLEDDGSITYEIRLPNGLEIEAPETALRARAFSGAWEPAEVLALGAAETQRWFDARWPAREALISLRSAAQGLTGIASASVELVGHQLDAIRRILHDPLQRYLLADEVGLGKTIEACAVLRQTLIDDPGSTALVLAPSALVCQWEQELSSRFDLIAGEGRRVQVLTHNALSDDLPVPSIVVVDEAHKIDPDSSAYSKLRSLSKGASKLLLLSATPAIGHETALLALLRLLDPERWENETETRFAEHVSRSQEYGRLLLGLRPDASSFVLKQRVLGALSLFPEDPEVLRLADNFQNAQTSEERGEACSRLRQHIADTYRIHQRLIRSRRADLEGWEFQPRGPASLRIEEDDDPALLSALLALEDWRAQASLSAGQQPTATDNLAERYLQLQRAISVGELRSGELKPLFEGEFSLLKAISDTLYDAQTKRAAFIAEVAQRQLRFLRQSKGDTTKLVVFVSDEELAERIVETLRAAEAEQIFDGAYGKTIVEPFAVCGEAAIAVFGPSGEEGLNLHFADGIIHGDLPTDIGRLEQRIGRLDRFGRIRGPIRHVIICPASEEDTPWSAWFDLLKDGFGVFDRPVSDLQFVLAEIETDVRRRRLEGPQSLLDFRNDLAKLVAQHRERLDEQYAMDQLAMGRESALALAESFEEAEADEADLQARVDSLLTSTLQFGVRRQGAADVFALEWRSDTQLPERPWQQIFLPSLGRPLTWKRRLSVSRPKTALLRPGASLIDALERLLEWDDRGAAFATWRFKPGLGGPGEERLAFRMCWIVAPPSPPSEALLPGEDGDALRRQAESLLQPWTLTQHVGPDLRPIEDPTWLGLLERPYQPHAETTGGRDFNLGSRPEWLRQVIDSQAFAQLCARATIEAAESLRASDAFQERITEATARAQREIDRRASRRALRSRLDGTISARRSETLDSLVCSLVANPAVRLDCIGAIVVAGYVPQGGR